METDGQTLKKNADSNRVFFGDEPFGALFPFQSRVPLGGHFNLVVREYSKRGDRRTSKIKFGFQIKIIRNIFENLSISNAEYSSKSVNDVSEHH